MGASITLKWGNLKGWTGFTEDHPAYQAGNAFLEATGASAMEWLDDKQKSLLCDLIDKVDGTITNDWSGEQMSKDEAKAYVREYGA